MMYFDEDAGDGGERNGYLIIVPFIGLVSIEYLQTLRSQFLVHILLSDVLSHPISRHLVA